MDVQMARALRHVVDVNLVSSPAFAPVYDRRFFFGRKALGTALQSDDGAYLIIGTVLKLDV
jgi:hypothetical protein